MKIPAQTQCDACQTIAVKLDLAQPGPLPRWYKVETGHPFEYWGSRQLHFCSIACMTAWAESMEREAEASTAAERRAHAEADKCASR